MSPKKPQLDIEKYQIHCNTLYKGSGDPREESGFLRFVLGIFNNRVSRGCVVDCHWELVAFERGNSSWSVTPSIPVVTVSSWITLSRSDVQNA